MFITIDDDVFPVQFGPTLALNVTSLTLLD